MTKEDYETMENIHECKKRVVSVGEFLDNTKSANDYGLCINSLNEGVRSLTVAVEEILKRVQAIDELLEGARVQKQQMEDQ